MATGIQRHVRRGLLARLKAHSPLTTLVPAASINPQGIPAWPWVLLDAPVTQRLRASGVNGGQGSFDVHAFARARLSSGAEVETAEDHAGRIGGAIEGALADARFTLETGAVCHIALSDIRLLRDEEPDAYHWFAQVNWRVLAA